MLATPYLTARFPAPGAPDGVTLSGRTAPGPRHAPERDPGRDGRDPASRR